MGDRLGDRLGVVVGRQQRFDPSHALVAVHRLSWMPAACLTIWASGQNVMPSPYGRHRPLSTVARSSRRLDELVRESRLADARTRRRP